MTSLPHKMNAQIMKSLNEGNFPFASNSIIGTTFAPYLANKEFASCSELLKKRFPYEYGLTTIAMVEKLMEDRKGIQTMIQDREKNVKAKLETAAENITRSLFNIPSYVSLKASIDDKHEIDIDSDYSEFKFKASQERMEYLNHLAQKRIILNSLVHGSSLHTFKSAHFIIKKTIDKIDPQLFHLYNSFSALISFNLWMFNPNSFLADIESSDLLGMCKLDIENSSIQASGINFVTVLTECIKGAVDFLISKGLPNDVSADELKYIYSISDNHKDESWYYYLSPTVWSDLIDKLEIDTQKLPEVISKLSLLGYLQLSNILQSAINGTPSEFKNKLSLI